MGALVAGCGGRGSGGTNDNTTSSFPQTLSELPAGTYTGTLTRQVGTAVTYLAQVKVNVTSDQSVTGVVGTYTPNLADTVYAGTISGDAFLTPTWQNALNQPVVTIDMGDGSGPTKHLWVFDEPIEQGGHVFVTAHIDEDALQNPDPDGPAISKFITFNK